MVKLQGILQCAFEIEYFGVKILKNFFLKNYCEKKINKIIKINKNFHSFPTEFFTCFHKHIFHILSTFLNFFEVQPSIQFSIHASLNLRQNFFPSFAIMK